MRDNIPAEFWQWAFRQVKLERKPQGDPDNVQRAAYAQELTAAIWAVIRRYKNAPR